MTIAEVEKNVELTIKHESHDLAVAGTTHIACACGNAEECGVNKGATTGVKKNGETPPELWVHNIFYNFDFFFFTVFFVEIFFN